jgi:hypothetical protein
MKEEGRRKKEEGRTNKSSEFRALVKKRCFLT